MEKSPNAKISKEETHKGNVLRCNTEPETFGSSLVNQTGLKMNNHDSILY